MPTQTSTDDNGEASNRKNDHESGDTSGTVRFNFHRPATMQNNYITKNTRVHAQ